MKYLLYGCKHIYHALKDSNPLNKALLIAQQINTIIPFRPFFS